MTHVALSTRTRVDDVAQNASVANVGSVTVPRPRHDALDLLRGVALFGILVVNLQFFANPVYDAGANALDASPLARVAAWLIAFAFEAKFFVLFSFLFGYGVAVQLARGDEESGRTTAVTPTHAAPAPGDARPSGAGRRHARRLVGLLAFGVVHATLLFVGDILVSYALFGAALWWVRAWSPRRLVRLAIACLAVAIVGHAAIVVVTSLPAMSDTQAMRALAEEATRSYRGGFGDAMRQRVRDLAVFYLFTPLFNWPTIAAMFALGLAAGKIGFARDLVRHRPTLRRWLPVALVVGIVGNVAYASFTDVPAGASTARALLGAVSFIGLALAGPALASVYAYVVIAMDGRPQWGRRLAPVRAAGRMSLTNYLGQAICASVLFNGYGFAWYGRVGANGLLAIAVVLYAGQLAFSTWWLRRFRLGPDEWLLRCWTEWRRVPLRRAIVAPAIERA